MKLYLVGIGPGDEKYLTPQAGAAIAASDLVVGYSVYTDLLRASFPEKEYFCTPMRREVDRCRAALAAAQSGRTVSVVCSGDAGVYGMAGLTLELAADSPEVEIEVVPGITAACSGAAVLGAPIGHDFAVISLSDLLTPWELIERRLRAAGEADFCICLYNPGSQKRADYLRRACGLLLESRAGTNACGWVREIGRPAQAFGTLTLAELCDFQADMFTTIFVGNSRTTIQNGRMVTPRGYRLDGED